MPFTELQRQLDERAAQGLQRRRRVLESPQGVRITVDGKPCLSFCSNDYLGLANHPQLIAALQAGAKQHGVGGGASHLVSGHFDAHQQLENELAAFVHKPAALLFSTGYLANLGAVQALVGRDDTVFADKLNHASLNDAMLLSRADIKRYRHNDVAHLQQLLEQTNGHGNVAHDKFCHAHFPLSSSLPQAGESDSVSLRESHVKCGRKLIITDAVFSMDGDLAPLTELLALCERYDAWLLVDDAHGFGVLGEEGRGSLAHFGLDSPRIIHMATLGKAAGVSGAFVAAEQVVIDTLVQNARSYIYTTASPPALSSALLASLEVLREEEWRREQLCELIAQLRGGLSNLPWTLMLSSTPIQPLLVGSNEDAVALSDGLRARGIWVPAIRPPTVPQGTARLRISLSSAHCKQDVMQLIKALHELAQ